jgi:hypothetical protein
MTPKQIVETAARRAATAASEQIWRMSMSRQGSNVAEMETVIATTDQREFAWVEGLIEAAIALRHCSHACVPPCPHTRKYEQMAKALAAIPEGEPKESTKWLMTM